MARPNGRGENLPAATAGPNNTIIRRRRQWPPTIFLLFEGIEALQCPQHVIWARAPAA